MVFSVLTVLTILICLILQQKFKIIYKDFLRNDGPQEAETNVRPQGVTRFLSAEQNDESPTSINPESRWEQRVTRNVANDDSDDAPIIRNRINPKEMRATLVFSYREETYDNVDMIPLEFDETIDVFEEFKHKVLLVLLLCTYFVVSIITFDVPITRPYLREHSV
jgi:hypothetical protein